MRASSCLLVLGCVLAAAHGQDVAPGKSEIEKQLQKRLEEFTNYFNAHDAGKLSELYAVDCDVAHGGKPHSGRREMEAEFAKYFAMNPTVTNEYANTKYLVLSERFAMETGTWTEANHSAPGISTSGNYTCLYENRDGRWVIVHERAWPDKDSPMTAKPAEALAPIGNYLWGDWKATGKIAGNTVQGVMNVRPTAEGKAQFYEWEFESNGRTNEGSAIGGIDPVTGSVVETAYGADGDHWIIRYAGDPLNGLGTATGIRIGKLNGQPFRGDVTVKRTALNRFTYQVAKDGENVIDIVFERMETRKNQ